MGNLFVYGLTLVTQGNDVLQASLGAEKKNSLVISELKGNFSNLENELQNVRLSKEVSS